jgi:DNA-binding transcriptional ArsR family regulator
LPGSSLVLCRKLLLGGNLYLVTCFTRINNLRVDIFLSHVRGSLGAGLVEASSIASRGIARHMAQAKVVHAALRGIGRNLLSVDDPAMDLPLRQLKVCMALLHRSCSMTEISREVGLSRSSVTQVSDRLERRGLVERELQSDDRRVRNWCGRMNGSNCGGLRPY